VKKIYIVPLAALVTGMLISCSPAAPSTDTGSKAGTSTVEPEPGLLDPSPSPTVASVYKFGDVVKFADGSTLTVSRPVEFKRDQYAAGGEKQKVFVKVKLTFTNNTKGVFDPSLTTAAASAGGAEGEAVYQDGLQSPTNKILPGKSVSWEQGFGVASTQDLQVEVAMGFLDYGTVVFAA
jgi:hypothetical protein